MKESWRINASIAAVSALAWVASFTIHNHFLSFLTHSPGIDLLFIPSGIRLIALMIGGLWAAIGVCLGSLMLTGPEFNTGEPLVILLIAVCSGFCPYVALQVSMRVTGVEPGLGNLRAIHLPFISIGVALGSSVLHNVLFSALGLSPWQAFGDHVLAMATGDFFGILAAMVIVFVFLRIFRKPTV